jgi:phage-related protein
MSGFPRLKTNAVMQYPAARVVEFSTQVVRFVDGSEQRYRNLGAPLRSWVIRLELLDESELAALEDFFTGMQGAFGAFTFTDPRDGREYANCSLEREWFATVLAGEMRGGTVLVVRENGG